MQKISYFLYILLRVTQPNYFLSVYIHIYIYICSRTYYLDLASGLQCPTSKLITAQTLKIGLGLMMNCRTKKTSANLNNNYKHTSTHTPTRKNKHYIHISPPRLGGYVCQLFCLERCLPTLPMNG